MTEVLECYTERNRKKADFTILLSFCTQFANVNLTSGYPVSYTHLTLPTTSRV